MKKLITERDMFILLRLDPCKIDLRAASLQPNQRKNEMQRISRMCLCLFTLLFAATSCAMADSEEGWKSFKGAWFSVEYPSGFQVRPSLKSRTSVKGVDSAFFTSPDGAVEFYVFSPQWNGEPSDIALKPETEELVSEKVENKPDERQKMGAKLSVRWFTIAARDKSYTRSYVDTENKQLNTRYVMGIKYPDQKVYKDFRDIYLKFVNSLRQFGD